MGDVGGVEGVKGVDGRCLAVTQEGCPFGGREEVEGVRQTLGAHLWGAEERGEAGGAAGVAETRWWLWSALNH